MRARAKRAGRTLIAGAALAALAACSIMTSVDGLSGGSSGDGGGDASGSNVHPDGASSGSSSGGGSGGGSGGVEGGGDDGGGGDDAGIDATSADTGSPGDGAIADARDGATVDAADAGATWCSTQSPTLLFCDDFDRNPLATGFDRFSSLNGTTALSGGVFTSAPNAMLVTTTSGAQQVDSAGYRAFPGVSTTTGVFTLSFDIRVVAADQTNKSDAVVCAIQQFDSFNTYWDFQLETTWNSSTSSLDVYLSENSELGDGGSQYHSTLASQKLPLGTWTRVSMEATFAGGTSAARLLFGGTQVAVAPLHVTTVNGTAEILVGATYVQPGDTSWNVRYDDVTFSKQ